MRDDPAPIPPDLLRWVFDLDITKARSLMGYQPRWDIGPMIESALAVQRGKKEAM